MKSLLFLCLFLEIIVVLKSIHFSTTEKTNKNSAKIYGQAVLGSLITNPDILGLEKEIQIMKRYGYHRTSTKEQHLDRGILEITKYCSDNNLELEKNIHRPNDR